MICIVCSGLDIVGVRKCWKQYVLQLPGNRLHTLHRTGEVVGKLQTLCRVLVQFVTCVLTCEGCMVLTTKPATILSLAKPAEDDSGDTAGTACRLGHLFTVQPPEHSQ